MDGWIRVENHREATRSKSTVAVNAQETRLAALSIGCYVINCMRAGIQVEGTHALCEVVISRRHALPLSSLMFIISRPPITSRESIFNCHSAAFLQTCCCRKQVIGRTEHMRTLETAARSYK